jgi:hypothetical protein
VRIGGLRSTWDADKILKLRKELQKLISPEAGAAKRKFRIAPVKRPPAPVAARPKPKAPSRPKPKVTAPKKAKPAVSHHRPAKPVKPAKPAKKKR